MTLGIWARPTVAKCGVTGIAILSILGAASSLAQTPTVEPGVIEREFERPIDPQSTGRTVLPGPLLPGAPESAAKISFILNEVRFEGGGELPPSELQRFAAPYIGKSVSLQDVYEISASITRAYSALGYPLSVAVVPAQDIEDGIVKIIVIEGYISEIEIAGDAGRADRLLREHGEKLSAERPLSRGALERYLLLANDIPGLEVTGVFDQAPDANGGVKLVLNVKRKALDIAVGANNRGSRALGRARGTVSLTENGLLTGRESLGFDVVQTFDGSELTYLGGTSSFILNAEGTVLKVSGTYSNSEPGTPSLQALDFNSDGWSVYAELSHPFIRSRSKNLRGIVGFEVKNLESRLADILNSQDKLRVLKAGAVFDMIDDDGAVTQVSAFINKGVDIFDATRLQDINKSRLDGDGSFVTASGEISRRQPLGGGAELFVAGGGQLTSRQLLASEECGYGGAGFGRGFDNFEISGDSCLYGAVELRRGFRASPMIKLQPYAFYDAGSVWQRGALLPGEDRQRTGQSVGAGMRMALGEEISASVEYAKPLTRDVALEGNDDGRLFFTISLSH